MNLTISIGTQDFEKIRQSNSFYIDKSMLIKEWWECRDDVTLITRPRRFGKTLNLSMIHCFFSNTYSGRGDLFEGLESWKEEEYRRLQRHFPVIYLSFADIKGTDYETARTGIIRKLVKLYSNHVYVREQLNAIDSASFDLVRMDMDDAAATAAIQNMTDYLYQYYGKKVLILLDEYDTPLQEAYANGYWEKLAAFIRSLFNSTFKTNPHMECGLMTGITRVSIASCEAFESIFSDLNNLEAVTTTSQKYCAQFGFTFGSLTDIYNPWSITCLLENGQYRPYWAYSSSNRLISSLIQQGNSRTKMIMEDLLERKPLVMELDETNGRFTYYLQLTNREVRMMFEDMIKDWFSNEDTPYNAFLQAALWQINEKNYDTGLIAKGFPKEKIRHYGFAFEGKKILIG